LGARKHVPIPAVASLPDEHQPKPGVAKQPQHVDALDLGTESAAHNDELPPHVHALEHVAGVEPDEDATHEPTFSSLPHHPYEANPRHEEHDVALEPVGPPPPVEAVVTHATDGLVVELAHAERRADTGEHAVGPVRAAVKPTFELVPYVRTPHVPGAMEADAMGSRHAGSDAAQS
jgi:hypothetical protein